MSLYPIERFAWRLWLGTFGLWLAISTGITLTKLPDAYGKFRRAQHADVIGRAEAEAQGRKYSYLLGLDQTGSERGALLESARRELSDVIKLYSLFGAGPPMLMLTLGATVAWAGRAFRSSAS